VKLVLHNYWRSSASHRVRIALNLKKLAYDYVVVNILKREQHVEAYRVRNPMAQVPALEVTEDDGTVRTIHQSLPILEYLEERWPEVPIMPRDLFLRARMRGLAEIVNSGIQPHQNLTTTLKVKALGGDEALWTAGFIADGIVAFARATAETAGTFCVGDAPTVADCCLIPQLASARRFGVLGPTGWSPTATWVGEHRADLDRLLEIETRCLALPAFVDAAPERQPDAVKPT
jgi:maleylpyruvate isomerase